MIIRTFLGRQQGSCLRVSPAMITQPVSRAVMLPGSSFVSPRQRPPEWCGGPRWSALVISESILGPGAATEALCRNQEQTREGGIRLQRNRGARRGFGKTRLRDISIWLCSPSINTRKEEGTRGGSRRCSSVRRNC